MSTNFFLKSQTNFDGFFILKVGHFIFKLLCAIVAFVKAKNCYKH
jgi:hypothetical protein